MRYRVFGEVALLPDQGPPHPLRRRRERTVLAVLLAAHGRPVTAERLLADVWGESSAAGLGSLQVAVSRLRADLEPGRSPREAPRLLVSTGGGYALVAGTADVDAWQFESLAARALGADNPAAALRLGEQATRWWAGAPYADCDTELLARERDRLEELRASLLERRAEDLLALGRDREALNVATDALGDNPYRERLWAALALAHYRGGRQAEALATLRTLRERLADELGVDPTPEVQDLEQRLLRQDAGLLRAAPVPAVGRPPEPDLPVEPAPHAAPAGVAAAPTVGREELGERMVRLLDGLSSGGASRFRTVTGEPGIGKTRAVDDLLRLAGHRGLRTAVGRCPESGLAPPLWPWVAVVRALADQVSAPDALRPLLEDQPAEADRGAGTRLRLYDAVVDLVVGAATRSHGLVVVLEDLHRADASSLQLLAHLAATAPPAPLLVVVTRRSTDVASAEEPMLEALAALARAGAEGLRLEGLDPAAVRRLMSGLLGDHDSALDDKVAEATAGNPFYVAEYARLLSSRPDLARLDPSRLPVPDGVRDVLRQRLGRLPAPARTLLGQAAVLGQVVDPGLVAAVSGEPEEEVLDVLDLAVASGLLVGQGASFRFAHALTREALLDDLSPARRIRWHARALAALEQTHPDPAADVVTVLAGHALAAAPLGAEARAAARRWLSRAATLAAGRQAHLEAVDLWRAAAGQAEPEGSDWIAARQGEARALLRLGHFADSRAVVGELVTAAVRRQDWTVVADSAAISTGAGVWPWREHGGKDEPLIAALTGALEHVEGVEEARLCATLMMEHHLGFDRDLTTSYGDRASAAAMAAGDADLVDQVLYLRALSRTGRRRPGDREERLALLEELLERRPGGEIEVAARFHLGWTLFDLGRVAESDAAMAGCAEAAAAVRHAGVDVPLAWWRAARARDRDDACAGQLADEALRLHVDSDLVGAAEARCVHAVATRVAEGTLADDVVALARQCGPPTQAVVAWGLVESGQPGRVVGLVDQLVPPVVEDYAALAGACLQLGVLAALGDRPRAAVLAEQLLPNADDVVTYGGLDHLGVVDHFLALGLRSLGRHDEALGRARRAVDRNRELDVLPWLRRSEELVATLEREEPPDRPA
jgi:DNA-binding SARP family transcriptional activator